MLHTTAPPPAAPDTGQLLSVSVVPGGRPGRVVVEVTGEVDAYTAPALDLCLHSQARQHGVRVLVVDLSRVTFLDSTGLGVLVTAMKRIDAHGGRMQLVVNGDRVMKVFRITALTRLFTIHPTLETALAS